MGVAGSLLGLVLYLALRDAGLPAPAFLDNAVNALVLPAAGQLIVVRRPRLPLGWVLRSGCPERPVDVAVGELGAVPAAVEVAAYLVVAELVTNACRHSGASRVRLTALRQDGELRLQVSDDGRGIPVGAPAGVGLDSVRRRVEEVGGELGRVSRTGHHGRRPAAAGYAMTVTIRVRVVDDHPLYREGLRSAISAMAGIEVVGEAVDGDEAVRQAVALDPDVVLMDLQMPHCNGIDATRALSAIGPRPAVLALTMLDGDEAVGAALRAGASGYLLTGAGRAEIERAITVVACGAMVVGNGVGPGSRAVATLQGPDDRLGVRRARFRGTARLSVGPSIVESMFDELSVREVESELVGMAGHVAAGTCRFLQLLAEFDTRDGWAGPGLRSCAHWLNWRVGMDTRTARDQLRTAHALQRLPATTAAFSAGRVSYSKVRALTRIATPDNEEVLLGVALHGTAAQLDALVAAARAGADPRPAAARRGLFYARDADGSLRVRLRIPAADGERFLAAITAELDAAAAPVGPGSGSAEPHPDDPEVDGPAQELGPAEVHRQWQAGRTETCTRATEHAPGAVLEPVAARRLDALLGLISGDHQHAEPATLVVHLRVDDLAGGSVEQGTPETTTIEPIDTDIDTDAAGTAAADADVAQPIPVPGNSDPAPTPGLRPVAWLETGPVLAVPVAERLTCTATVQALLVDRSGNPLYLGRTRRVASRAQLRALRVRDGHRCGFPGCDTTRHLEAHHVRWGRHYGPTDLDNLILTCGFHHGLIHDHGYRVHRGGDGFVFARPDGTPVPAAGPPLVGRADDLVARHTAHRIAIDDQSITPRWGGERLDADVILRWLVPELRADTAA